MHQHIFKVGWLLTQNYETTTILYYTFFLPGIILHEVIYWLVAGLLDVRAERSIKWPEKQEIGELRLNFVQLARRTGRIQRAIISSAPLIIGLVIVWLMATNIGMPFVTRVMKPRFGFASLSSPITAPPLPC